LIASTSAQMELTTNSTMVCTVTKPSRSSSRRGAMVSSIASASAWMGLTTNFTMVCAVVKICVSLDSSFAIRARRSSLSFAFWACHSSTSRWMMSVQFVSTCLPLDVQSLPSLPFGIPHFILCAVSIPMTKSHTVQCPATTTQIFFLKNDNHNSVGQGQKGTSSREVKLVLWRAHHLHLAHFLLSVSTCRV